jgi:hypothetical protein
MGLSRQKGLDVEQASMMILRLRRSYLHRICLPVWMERRPGRIQVEVEVQVWILVG